MVSLLPTSSLKTNAAGTSQAKDGTQTAATPPDALATEVRQAFESLGAMKEQVKSVQERLAASPPPPVAEQEEEEAPTEEVDPFTSPELETLSRADLGRTVSRHAQLSIKKELAPLLKQVAQLTQQVAAANAKADVADFRADHPDVMDWRKELGAIYGKPATSGLPLSDAYALVRSKDPEKATALDKKYGKGGGSTQEEDVQKGGQAELPEGYVPKGFQVQPPRQRTEADLKLFSLAPGGQAESDRTQEANRRDMPISEGVRNAMSSVFAGGQTRIQRGVRG